MKYAIAARLPARRAILPTRKGCSTTRNDSSASTIEIASRTTNNVTPSSPGRGVTKTRTGQCQRYKE